MSLARQQSTNMAHPSQSISAFRRVTQYNLLPDFSYYPSNPAVWLRKLRPVRIVIPYYPKILGSLSFLFLSFSLSLSLEWQLSPSDLLLRPGSRVTFTSQGWSQILFFSLHWFLFLVCFFLFSLDQGQHQQSNLFKSYLSHFHVVLDLIRLHTPLMRNVK